MSNSAALRLQAAFMGPDQAAGRLQYQRARSAGISALRALMLGDFASFKDGWVWRKTVAAFRGGSVKTAQRAINDGRSEGLMDVARGKKGEKPPGWSGEEPPWCGFSHRWMIGRDLVGGALQAAIAWAKAKALTRQASAVAKAVERNVLQRRAQKLRRLTDDDRAELERIDADSRAREQPP